MEVQIITLPTEVNELAVKVSANKRAEVQTVLQQIFTGTDDWEKQVDAIEVKDINDKMSIELAEVARKNSKQARLSAEKIFDAKRKEVQNLKAEFDLEDKLWLKAKQVMQIKFKAIEEKAEWQANFVKRFEAEQKELRTQKRINEVSKYAEINRIEFEAISDESFDSFLSGLKSTFEAKIEAERKAEEERVAKEKADVERKIRFEKRNKELSIYWSTMKTFPNSSNFNYTDATEEEYQKFLLSAIEDKINFDNEQEERRLENERLKAESEKREKEEVEKQILHQKRQKELQPYIVFIRDYNSLISKPELEYKKEFSDIKKGAEDHWEYERKEQLRKQKEEEANEIARKKVLAENEAKLKKEQEAKAKLEAELQAKKDAEIKAENERKQAELKAKVEAEKNAKAPIKKQLSIWVDGFSIAEINVENEKKVLIKEKFEAFKKWAKNEIESI